MNSAESDSVRTREQRLHDSRDEALPDLHVVGRMLVVLIRFVAQENRDR